jgi:hypothetical protein
MFYTQFEEVNEELLCLIMQGKTDSVKAEELREIRDNYWINMTKEERMDWHKRKSVPE